MVVVNRSAPLVPYGLNFIIIRSHLSTGVTHIVGSSVKHTIKTYGSTIKVTVKSHIGGPPNSDETVPGPNAYLASY